LLGLRAASVELGADLVKTSGESQFVLRFLYRSATQQGAFDNPFCRVAPFSMNLPRLLLAVPSCLLALQPLQAATVQIVANAADAEVRQASTGAFTIGQGTAQRLRVGFQLNFGSDGQAAGGIDAYWYFQLPQLDLAGGQVIVGADFVTTLMEETAASPITPRFNADLYALGFVTNTAALPASSLTFFAGQDQTGIAGLGSGQTVQKIDNDYFTIFTDWEAVNVPTPKTVKPFSTDASGRLSLAAYVQGIYNNPAFPNTGNEFLVLRMNPDRAANETYDAGGPQFYGKGTSRYQLGANESSTLTNSATVNYDAYVPTTVTLDIVPEPGSAALILAGTGLFCTRRRSASERITRR
jgi:hypothetical protein